jgi:hypothetical protein
VDQYVRRNAHASARSQADIRLGHGVAMAIQIEDAIELALDRALEATFPASDPVSISSAAVHLASVARARSLDLLTKGSPPL